MSYIPSHNDYQQSQKQLFQELSKFSAKFVPNKNKQNPVSQLANSKTFLLKTIPDKDYTVRQSQNPSGVRTHTRAYKNNLFLENPNLSIKHLVSISQFLYPDIAVKIHNTDYLSSKESNYCKSEFENLICAITILRKPCRITNTQGMLLSTDEDFFTAYKLLKRNNTKGKSMKHKIWAWLQEHYQDQEFSSRIIRKKFVMDKSTIKKYLNEWLEDQQIQHIHTATRGLKIYKITKQ